VRILTQPNQHGEKAPCCRRRHGHSAVLLTRMQDCVRAEFHPEVFQ